MGEFPELPKRVPLRVPRPEPELNTAEEMCKAIRRIVKRQQTRASQSQYDVMVCIRSVSAARAVFEGVPVEGSPIGYANAVKSALDALHEVFWDNDGEYTSRGMVGDVCSDVYQLLDRQYAFKHPNIDEKEVRRVINREMTQIVASMEGPSTALNEANIKTEAQGSSGTTYFLEFTFTDASNDYARVTGKIYSDELCENLIATDVRELFSGDD